MKKSFLNSQTAALSILFLSLSGMPAKADPPKDPSPAPPNVCRWGAVAAKGQQIHQQAEAMAVDPALVDAELDRLGGFIDAYQTAVANHDPLASQKLSESIQIATGVDPTDISSEFMNQHLSSIRQHGDAAKGIATALAGLTADLQGVQTGEEKQVEDKSNFFLRRGKEFARAWGLTKAVKKAVAMESTGNESMTTITGRVRTIRDGGIGERETILSENALILGKAAEARRMGIFFQAIGIRANQEMANLDPASSAYLAAEVTRDSYLRSSQAHLENEQLFRKAIKTNAIVLEQINLELQTMTTRTNVQLSSIATSLATAQSAHVATNLATVNDLVDQTAADAELKVATAVSELAKMGQKAGERTRLTREKVDEMIRIASETTAATEKARKDAVMGNIERLLTENRVLESSNITDQTRLGFVQPGGLNIAGPKQGELMPVKTVKPIEDGK